MDQQQNTPWQYKPDNTASSNDLTPNEVPQPAPPRAGGPNPVSWQSAEFIEHDHSPNWYVALIAGTVGLSAIIYFVTRDYFAAGTVVVMGAITAVLARRKPRLETYELTKQGLKAGDKLYEYSLFKSFSIIQEGNLKSLSLLPLKRFAPPVSAYFEDKDEESIVNLLGEYLPFEERKADAIDRLSHRLRF